MMNRYSATKTKKLKKLLPACLLSLGALSLYAVDFFELGPIHYSASVPQNAMSELAHDADKALANSKSDLEFLRAVLDKLEIDPNTQTLVFSKTSVQKSIIGPSNPRALYFSDNAYVGYVPGGILEVIVHDPKLGLVFYVAKKTRDGNGIIIERDQACLSCHVSARTQDVPGLFMRSLATDKFGNPDLKQASYDVTDETPFQHRWGGWYVTGNWEGSTHLGNSTLDKNLGKLDDLANVINTDNYLKSTSDITALLVLEHQCKMHSAMVAAQFQYKRSLHLEMALDKNVDVNSPDSPTGQMADRLSDDIVEDLLFCNEAPLKGNGVEGGEAFKKAFVAAAVKTKKGKHLRKLRLYGRLFKYRCSYMIHSDAFLAMPTIIQKKVLQKLHHILTAEDVDKKFRHLQHSEKSTILKILMETTAMKQYVE